MARRARAFVLSELDWSMSARIGDTPTLQTLLMVQRTLPTMWASSIMQV